MLRKIIEIDEEKCNGCGACAAACHEGAIGMVNGKARLLRDDYCDGLGDCLPACPTGAITFTQREAALYDAQAVAASKAPSCPATPHHCPGSLSHAIRRESSVATEPVRADEVMNRPASRLGQWPVQIKLAPINAPYFNHAKLLIAADCTAFAYADFHEKFMKNHVTLVGCPKLDAVDYSQKLTEILKANDIQSITVVRMEVPCCGGIDLAVRKALQASGKMIPWQVYTLSTDGHILE